MIHPAIAKKAVIERVHTDANGLQIMDNTVKLTLLDKDDNVMAIWWGAEALTQCVGEAHNVNSRGRYREEIVHIAGFGLKATTAEIAWDEIDALDKRQVQALLALAERYKAAFMHPAIQNDPACRLARQLASAQLGPELCDTIVVNGGYGPQDGYRPIAYHLTPVGNMTDFLAAGARPRPVWMAWYPQAKAALEALKKLEEA